MSEQVNSNRLPLRSEVEEKDTWRLEDIFATDELWEEEFHKLAKMIPQVEQYKGKLGNSASDLYAALQFRDGLSERLGQLYTYAHMRFDQDTTNSVYQSLDDRAKGLLTKASSHMSFIVPEILSLSEEQITNYLQENKDLQLYTQELAELNQQRPHVLSEAEESIMAQLSEVTRASSSTFSMLNNADLTFPEIKDSDGNPLQVTHGRYRQLLDSTDRRVRRDAFQAVYSTYGSYINTFASTLSGQIKGHNVKARIRKYDSARQAALSNNHIPETVYDQLVEGTNEHLSLLHRYIALRKKALGLDELHIYDMYTPLISEVEFNVTYEEAKEILIEALQPLGEEYISILKEAFDNRWVDVYENKGKRSGAYSSGTYGTNPYILMNWQDNLDSLFTLAHEFGHSIHSYYTRKEQPYPYGNYTIFVAEVASTCNEQLLLEYLLKKTDDPRKRLYLINHYLESFRGTFFRQTMFAEFEHLIHQKVEAGEALTPDTLTSSYLALNKKYFGPEVSMDDEIGLEWARIPHFYYNYYVYQYATGYTAAAALSKKILEEGKPAVDRYLGFLKAGSSDYPIEVLKKAGVDMTTSVPTKASLNLFEEKLIEMEKALEATN
ncbi:oligoendopeptidase F [Mechercharimyces sp. CAU 1602]|uniref:oligoendopeptidase F n=1 Tax=Mechercharimyces sp. CAU 1602 TaxID=2973933 RepID=UPI002163D061|nr:oligoendopeptidase F [Mechercharimyces sp. CAU 1602]MCS1351080.1 oligoendopeptidase F [Mechercharimyces sp. CAU 1602]